MADDTARRYAASQYASTDRLDARIAIHRYGSQPQPLHLWMWDRLPVRAEAAVLDVGAGTGAFWAAHEPHHPWPALTLTDASPAMCAALVDRGFPGAQVRCCLADALPFADETFDGAVAAHMLYHLDEPVAALRELRRVLRPGGWFAATTNDDDSMGELDELIETAGVVGVVRPSLPNFRGNGPSLVAEVFGAADVARYDDVLRVTDAMLVVDYLATFGPLDADARAALYEVVDRTVRERGHFPVTKRVMLISATR